MSSPVRSRQHGKPHALIIGWLVQYLATTPGVNLNDNSTLRLDPDNEPQPDAMLWLDEAHGGQTWETEDDYVTGVPELIVEVAASSAAYDLHDKLRAYRRNGVPEYLILLAHEQDVVWYALEEGAYRPLEPDGEGVLRSEVFPGLWLRPEAIWENDPAGLLATLHEGVDSDEHDAFVNQLRSVEDE